MPTLEEIRAWKKKWGYDDFSIMPGDRPMKSFQPDAEAVKKVAANLGVDVADSVEEIQKEIGGTTDPTYDPMKAPLATSILDRIRDRSMVDRTAAIDQVTDTIYGKDRRKELMNLTKNHYLANEYALRTIGDGIPLDDRSGIRIDHEKNSRYQRDMIDKGVRDGFEAIYKKHEKAKGLPKFHPNSVFFVNNPSIVSKLDSVYTANWVDPKAKPYKAFKPHFDKVVELEPGISVILMTNGKYLNGKEAQGFRGRLIEGAGATPSSYQVMKGLDAGPKKEPLDDPKLQAPSSLKNKDALDRVAASKGCERLAALPDRHPMKQAGKAAAQMVKGLKDVLQKTVLTSKPELFEKNILVQSALEKIERLMEAMPTYTEDTPRFSRLFDLLVDEVYLVLATCKPYDKNAFRAATNKVVEDRVPALTTDPALKDVKPETFLLSSGMDAISTAVDAAFRATGSSKLQMLDDATSHVNYFEIEYAVVGSSIKQGSAKPATPPVIMGTVNPSTPTRKPGEKAEVSWSVDKLIEKIDTALKPHLTTLTKDKPAVAILDITVEKEAAKAADQELNKIVAKFSKLIGEGKLQLLLCKSYQKYPSLGAGKAMSGGLTVLGAGEKANALKKTAGDTESSEKFLDNDESQVVTHFMTHEADVERAMLTRAARNSAFVKGFMPQKPDASERHAYDAGLPFVMMDHRPISFDGSGDKDLLDMLYGLGVEKRMSFGFQNSSALDTTNDTMRICAGQESAGELVEKFYAVSRLAAMKRPAAVKPEGIASMAGAAAQSSFGKVAGALKANAATEEGRERMVRVLLKAGKLKPADIERTEGAIVKPTDKELEKILDDIGSKASTTDPAVLGEKLAVVSAMLSNTVSDEAFKLSISKPDDRWREAAVKLLIARGALPEKEVQRDAEKKITAPSDEALKEKLWNLDDANLMHASITPEWDGPGTEKIDVSAKYLPNVVASCALTTAVAFPGQLDKFAALADPLIANGLNQLSPECRERLLDTRAKALFAKGTDEISKHIDDIAKWAEKMPYREGPANLLTSKELAQQLKTKPMTEKALDELTIALSGQLDFESARDLLNWFIALPAKTAEHIAIAKSCAKSVKARLADAERAYKATAEEKLKTPTATAPLEQRSLKAGAPKSGEHGPKPLDEAGFLKLQKSVTEAITKVEALK